MAHDLHPDYLSTAYALEREGVETVAVQHHHAHLAACLAEHGLSRARPSGRSSTAPATATDGTIWGGEILVGRPRRGAPGAPTCGRCACPAATAAIREPWRMACAWLAEAGGDEDPRSRRRSPAASNPGPGSTWRAWPAPSARRSPPAPAGCFDAVAALCGLRARVTYEGQAAVELEAACDPAERGAYPMDGLDPREAILAAVAGDLAGGAGGGRGRRPLPRGLAAATAAACDAGGRRRRDRGRPQRGRVPEPAAAGRRAAAGCRRAGLRVLIPERLPPNDGGISYGQAAVAAALTGSGENVVQA